MSQSHRTVRALLLCCALLVVAATAEAKSYARLRLHQRVRLSDTVVLARVVDPARALVSVERVLKGQPAKQITLVSYVDNFASPAERKPLVLNARELLFLRKQGEVYAPLQDQYGRFPVEGDRLVDQFSATPRSLPQTLVSIERLVALQAQAARTDDEADAAYVASFKDSDPELQAWAFWTAASRVKKPSEALIDVALASWPRGNEVRSGLDAGEVTSGVAHLVVAWRLERAAPFFVNVLTTSSRGEERVAAAIALGGLRDRAYLPVLRHAAKEDTHARARALAYHGITSILGPASLPDLRLGAKDSDEHVRSHVVVNAYNVLEFGHPAPRWPRPSTALIAEVRAFLSRMQRDPARVVSNNARSMLAKMARHRPHP